MTSKDYPADDRAPSEAAPGTKSRREGAESAGAAPREVDRPTSDQLARIGELSRRTLSPEEFDALVDAPISPEEEAANLELIRWFRRRYPTAAERLAYVRRAYARWTTALPDGGSASPPLKR